jgi:hypothetical protein
MEPRGSAHSPAQTGVADSATLYLCRQGPRWVVVIESPSVTGALAFRHEDTDAYDARFELLSSAHRACPEAEVVSADGALVSADYEWRLDVRGTEALPGLIGQALHRELSADSPQPGPRPHPGSARRCPWGPSAFFPGRPRSF